MTREEAIELVCYGDWLNILMPHLEDDDINRLAEAMCLIGNALCPVSREQVEQMWRGEWKHYLPPLGAGDVQCRCTRCGRTPDVETPFCAWCGAPMTEEAMQMVMRRLEELKDGNTTD